ncbi:MAG: hypothetical protein HYZ17_07310 [Betaproteobacteria bacterium]|nr:hypothetical protein [Betaproteobacteria bacterium]
MHKAFEVMASRRRGSASAAGLTTVAAIGSVSGGSGFPGKGEFLFRAAGFLLIGVLAGCSGMPVGGDPGEWVAKRAKARWEALIERDLDKAYGFLSPGSQATLSLAAYKSRIRPGMWRKAEVKAVKCELTACKVTMTITYDHKVMKNVQTDLFESWLIENGNAWYVFEG